MHDNSPGHFEVLWNSVSIAYTLPQGYSQLKEGLKDEQRERIRLTEEVSRLRKRNESLNRRMDQMKIEAASQQASPLHTGNKRND